MANLLAHVSLSSLGRLIRNDTFFKVSGFRIFPTEHRSVNKIPITLHKIQDQRTMSVQSQSIFVVVMTYEQGSVACYTKGDHSVCYIRVLRCNNHSIVTTSVTICSLYRFLSNLMTNI